MVTYSDSGVDIDLEEVTVAKLAEKLKPTLKYRDIITESGHFAALVKIGNRGIAMSTDGVGSKILVAKMMEKYDTIGIDCIAMVVNDILCVGAEPIALVDYLAVEEPNPEIAEEIAEGLAHGAKLSNIAIIGGETASLPEVVNDFDLAGTGIGFVDLDKIITGADISDGDILIGIRSSGIHSNGLSLARKVLLENNKFDINDPLPNDQDTTIGKELLRPTELYVKPIINLLENNLNIKGLAHITGGGFNNLKRLNKNVGFDINNLPEPQEIFKLIYDQGVSLEEMYKVFNMGIGFVVIVSEEDADKALDNLKNNCESYKIGKVTSDSNKVKITTFKSNEIEY
ncbi:phosphoribosylformylglycinamidine cyclo-ligase [Methanobrevibacter arboriphilus JCM 13429 = DSM 1125]|uniref:Phosphoribosylformylglycinamidine cyclo-ligase n=1 Tax=Methanobrevibacter arboriphilus JCM 13429 = DSM 1125 TaxID=1300164 RepID=A0A1V6N0T6_METAZ|nr:phosphoribosylformylglycinamidine cyclo-ligase [Methanobrevibacter arboriphilus]OQD58308.1 phosphoribosylformylglycinamidine cyclo-ligase [Methanobrevibacter arboriphilus JCM 13429 = DSM 1125]